MTLDVIERPAAGTAERLVVILHGWGATAQDVAGLAAYLRLDGATMLFPNAPFPHPMAPSGRMWYGFPPGYTFAQSTDLRSQTDLQQSREVLLSWLRSLPQTTGIPLERTILGGFSQGGAMTLEVGLELPLAALLVLSGYAHGPLAAPITPRPVLIVHGRQDAVVPLAQAQALRQQLQVPITYEEFDMGHEISMPALQIVGRFCQAQR